MAFGQDKKDIERMLNHMQSMGTFSPEQIEAAKKRLNNLSDEDVDAMVNKAHAAAQNPEYQNQAKEIIRNYKKNGGKISETQVDEKEIIQE